MATQDLMNAGRNFLRSPFTDGQEEPEGFKSDQDLKKPQPPLFKEPMGGEILELPTDFADVLVQRDYTALLEQRRSVRAYADTPMTLAQLSFLLQSTQGVQKIVGDNYAALRPVPSGGARHAFECYFAALNIEGLREGIYHYLPQSHAIEPVSAREGLRETVVASLVGQKWAAGAAAVFYYSVLPYRAEWRYSYMAHRVVLMDVGYAGQNLYLSSEAVGCGCCAVAAFDQSLTDALLGLDGEEEFTIYAAPVGVRKA